MIVLMLSDEVFAVFQSSFEHGDVSLVYCPHRRVYELRYAMLIQPRTGGGRRRLVWSAVAFDACDYAQVAHMLIDARALADTLLIER